MNCGEKIAKLRKQHNMTQAELGEQLCVTYQAVSKWERNESQPDFATISKIAKLFEVPITYFEDGADETVIQAEQATEQPTVEQPEVEQPIVEPVKEPQVVGMCVQCGKIVREGEEGETSPRLICKACKIYNIKEKERAALAAKKAKEDAEKHKQMQIEQKRAAQMKKFTAAFFWAILPAASMLILGLGLSIDSGDYTMLGGGVILAVFFYTFTVQMIWDGVIRSIALAGGWAIKLPGVIFSLSVDGFIFLILTKILLGLVAGLIFVGSIAICFGGAIFLSPFTFVPSLLLHLREARKV